MKASLTLFSILSALAAAKTYPNQLFFCNEPQMADQKPYYVSLDKDVKFGECGPKDGHSLKSVSSIGMTGSTKFFCRLFSATDCNGPMLMDIDANMLTLPEGVDNNIGSFRCTAE
ncbi:hypothetical protein F5B20DRAFT_534541 [Whalleya microplaca]|nr:hypothetical protein F5B20DRAFT_534541 [Whalleya microplaca]